MAASQRHEDILEADVAGRQAGQRPIQVVELVKQGGYGSMGLGNGQCVSLLSARAVRTESRPAKAAGSSGAPSPSIANSTMRSPPNRAINSRGRAQRDDLALVDDGHAVA